MHQPPLAWSRRIPHNDNVHMFHKSRRTRKGTFERIRWRIALQSPGLGEPSVSLLLYALVKFCSDRSASNRSNLHPSEARYLRSRKSKPFKQRINCHQSLCFRIADDLRIATQSKLTIRPNFVRPSSLGKVCEVCEKDYLTQSPEDKTQSENKFV